MRSGATARASRPRSCATQLSSLPRCTPGKGCAAIRPGLPSCRTIWVGATTWWWPMASCANCSRDGRRLVLVQAMHAAISRRAWRPTMMRSGRCGSTSSACPSPNSRTRSCAPSARVPRAKVLAKAENVARHALDALQDIRSSKSRPTHRSSCSSNPVLAHMEQIKGFLTAWADTLRSTDPRGAHRLEAARTHRLAAHTYFACAGGRGAAGGGAACRQRSRDTATRCVTTEAARRMEAMQRVWKAGTGD